MSLYPGGRGGGLKTGGFEVGFYGIEPRLRAWSLTGKE